MNTLSEFYRLKRLYVALERRKNVMGSSTIPSEKEGLEIELQQKEIANKIEILSKILEVQNGNN